MRRPDKAFRPLCVLVAPVCLACALLSCDDTQQDPSDEIHDVQATEEVRPETDVGQGDLPELVSPDTAADVGSHGEEVPIEPGDAFLERKASYLQACSDANGPEQGGLYGQVCRLVTGETTFNEGAITEALDEMDGRLDTSDFDLVAFARLLYLDNTYHGLPQALRASIEETLFGFRYWLSEPGSDKMCYWTENHQVLFHSGELLIGQLYPDQVFSNSGMTGAEHVAHAEPLLLRWLDFRGRIGFSEWHSNVYFNEDLPALLNLAEFAQNEEIRTKAAMVLDVLLIDMAANTYKGFFATTHGRTYANKYVDGLKDSTAPFVWLALGLGQTSDYGSFGAAFLATNEAYVPPPLLEEWANAIGSEYEHRQRDSIDVEEGPEWGVGYLDPLDIVFWAGASAILEPDVAYGFMQFLKKYSLWDGFLVGDIEEPYKGMLQKMGDDPESIRNFSLELQVVSRGMTLGSANTYTYRTPHYQLSGVQDYKKGLWSAQTLSWIAVLDGDAFVISSLPGNPKLIGGQEFGEGWVGGWQPRVTLHRSVGVIQYRTQEVPLFGEAFNTEFVRVLMRQIGFDEIVQTEPWVCGRKGEAYLCLASDIPLVFEDGDEDRLTAADHEVNLVIQMGSVEESGSFPDFVAQVTEAELEFGEESVRFASPLEGLVEVGWDGPMTVAGVAVDLGPYQRFEGEHVNQTWGESLLNLGFGERELELDFAQGTRRVWMKN